MHLLIIPGEELNGKNIYSSTFEISQANAVRSQFDKIGFISVKITHSILSPLKRKVINAFKKGDDGNSIKDFFLEFDIDGMLGIEATGLFKYQHLGLEHVDYIHLGLSAFKKYIKKNGKPDIIHCHGRFLTGGLIGYSIHRKFGIPYVYTEHSTIYQRGLATKKDYAYLTKVINHAKSWIAVSPSLGETVNSKIKVNKNYVFVPNVLDPLFERDDLPKENNSSLFKFLSVAAFHKKKGNEILIKAFAEKFKGISKYRLLLGGDGPDKMFIENLVKELGITKQVEFLGYLSRENVLDQMRTCDVFVLSSLYETFGVVVIEAMACGKPVIATKCGGPEAIVNDKNGLLIEANNVGQFADAMNWITSHMNQYDASAIKDDCFSRFGSKAVGRQLIYLYNLALNN